MTLTDEHEQIDIDDEEGLSAYGEDDDAQYFFEPCKHDDLVNYEPVDNSSGYFRPNYLEKHPTWPHVCAGTCHKDLVDLAASKIDKDKQYKVSSKNLVHVCPNARDTRHPCVHAFCTPCIQELKKKAPASSKDVSQTRHRVATPKAAKGISNEEA